MSFLTVSMGESSSNTASFILSGFTVHQPGSGPVTSVPNGMSQSQIRIFVGSFRKKQSFHICKCIYIYYVACYYCYCYYYCMYVYIYFFMSTNTYLCIYSIYIHVCTTESLLRFFLVRGLRILQVIYCGAITLTSYHFQTFQQAPPPTSRGRGLSLHFSIYFEIMHLLIHLVCKSEKFRIQLRSCPFYESTKMDALGYTHPT